MTGRQPAAFLDRDGVLNEDRGYVHDPSDIVWVPGVSQALHRLRDAGFFVFVVTNQAGVGRGLYGEEDVRALHDFMQTELEGAIDAFRYCPHHPEAAVARYRLHCSCRKPAPGMLEDLIAAFPVQRDRSFLIGDKESDLAAGRAAGIRSYRFVDGSLDALVQQILSGDRRANAPT